MARIIVLSSEWMSEVLETIVAGYSGDIKIEPINVNIENYVQKAMSIEREGGVDAFIAAANTKDICRYVKAPVINVEVKNYDILMAIKKAMETKKDDEKIAVLSYKSMPEGFHDCNSLLAESAIEEVYDNISDLTNKLICLKGKGVSRVVGTSIVEEKARLLGINGYIFYAIDGLKNAVDRAIEIVKAKEAASKRAASLETIFRNINGGIIVTDRHGFITEVNSAAENMISIGETTFRGTQVSELIPELQVDNLIKSNKTIANMVVKINKKQFIIDVETFDEYAIPIGLVISLQDISTVQKSEIAIRKKLHERGLTAKNTFDDIIAESQKMKAIKSTANVFAQNDSTILILGETGVGKDLFAQAIHNASKRAKAPYVAINCAAIPSQLLQSELFGYEENAFTGARKGGKAGLFELANNGTLFLDEIGEIDAVTQVQLLRVIDTKEIMRIGGDRIIPVNTRIIAATNRNLWKMVEDGKFREDLYYRLCVLEFEIPPLRERKEDIPLIATQLLNKYGKHIPNDVKDQVSKSYLLINNYWRGNIRELRNAIERFSAQYGVTKESPVEIFKMSLGSTNNNLISSKFETGSGLSPEIQEALRKAKGNREKAASILGISRTTLWRKMKQR